MLNDLFYAVLGMLPWTCALIAALLVLRHFARTTLSARFFRLAWLILAVRLALPVSFAVPVQDRPAPLSIPLPTAAVRQAALPAAPAESGGAQQAAASGPGKAVPVPSAPAPAGPLRSRPGLAGAVWLVGAALCLAARLAAYGTSMRRLRRGRVPLADETLADACRAAFGRSMRVYAVAGLDTPMLAGLLRPAVYLPEGAGLRADTLPYVLAHEARHRSAGDIPFQFVLAAACALHWFDPLVWCMARAARQDMELACDEAVLAGRDMAYRRAYGAAVLDVLASARRRRISALTTGFASGAGETRRRFAEMLSLRKKQRGTPLLCLLLALVVLASTLVACAAPARSDTAAPVYKGGTLQPTAGEAPEERLERLREELQTLQAEIGRLEALAAQDSSLEEIQRQYLQAQQEWAEWSAAVPEGAPSGGAAQFAWPLPGYTTLSSDFGTARRVYGAKDVHTGMDIPAPAGTPVSGAAAFAAKEQEIAAAEREYAEWTAQSDNDAPEYTGGAFYWPLPGYSTGSPMGWRTLNGVQEFHRGMDIPAPLGTKIYAAADGVVSTKAHYTYGTCVKLSHGGGLVTIYAHMSAWAEGIADGVPVKQGQLIGYVGRTGRAYGYHLHFEANLNGAPVDVRDYLG